MPHLEGQGVGELGQELNEARADCLANDEPCDMPRLGIEIPANHPLPLDDPEQATFYATAWPTTARPACWSRWKTSKSDPLLLAWLDSLVAAANTVMLPVIAQWVIWSFGFDGGDASGEHWRRERKTH